MKYNLKGVTKNIHSRTNTVIYGKKISENRGECAYYLGAIKESKPCLQGRKILCMQRERVCVIWISKLKVFPDFLRPFWMSEKNKSDIERVFQSPEIQAFIRIFLAFSVLSPIFFSLTCSFSSLQWNFYSC